VGEFWGRDTDARIGKRAVALWVRCGRSRLLAVVEDEPPEIVCIVSMTPKPDFRIVNGHVVNRGLAFIYRPGSLSVRCRQHRGHALLCDRIADAFERGIRNAEVGDFVKPS